MALAVLLTAPYWLIQGLRHGKYFSNLRERLGFSSPGLEKLAGASQGAIWIHAVSVGEALSGVPLVKQLKEKHPRRPIVVSTTTLTGFALAKERMPFADAFMYFPFDWAFCVRRALNAVRPALVLVLETEIWPNFLREAKRRDVPVVFVSGRISDRSFSRFQKYLGMFGFYLRPPADRVKVSGNLKYDMSLPEPTALSRWLAEECRSKQRWPVIVAGSVVATEEPLTLIAFGVVQGDFPRALLVLAPRKPERFGAAAEFIEESHRKFVRRSDLPVAGPGFSPNGGNKVSGIPDDASVLLLDSIGELASLYQLADGAFVGGSLVDAGGHNILEPAAFGKVPVFGPSMENFAAIASRFVEAGAAIQAHSPEDAGVEWIELLKQPEKMKKMGQSAKSLVENSRGALARALDEVSRTLDGATR
jgi:3-deoxy-D-manno-octulosonic-acid transferase